MKNTRSYVLCFFATILIVFTFIPKTFAAPGPSYLVVNEKTKQCGEYWTGDEFGQNNLPNGWVDAVTKSKTGLKTETSAIPSETEKQCTDLGYTYVENIDPNRNLITVLLLSVLLIGVVIGIVLFSKRKKGKKR